MVKKITTKRINSHRYKDFYKTATNFNEGAKVANEFEYFNAAGVLIIHAAIALADAITIKLVSEKCSGENHYEVINLLEEIIPKNKQRMINYYLTRTAQVAGVIGAVATLVLLFKR